MKLKIIYCTYPFPNGIVMGQAAMSSSHLYDKVKVKENNGLCANLNKSQELEGCYDYTCYLEKTLFGQNKSINTDVSEVK